MVSPKQYVREVGREAKRVRWPKRDVLIQTIITCVVIAGFFALILSLEDLAAGKLVNEIRNAFQGLR